MSESEDRSRDCGTTEVMPAEDAPVLPTRIGGYRVLSELGQGGFGVVYLAEQTEPVRRRVAVKVIKPGMDSEAVVARFEAERQALAVMDHPAVARVFDAGTTEGGRPFFVMEYVRGVPITEHCDRQRLSLRKRIGLFIQVCEAVQHAHMKGVIHRDLKPNNILVEYADQGSSAQVRPKVIDFGVAKSLDRPLTDTPLYTAIGDLIGTPEYMAPEQAGTSGQDIDTRADIYALGVVLYELLTGNTPLHGAGIRNAGIGEIIRVLRDEEPERPSARIGKGTAGSGIDPARRQRIADRRQTDPNRLQRELRNDLDWIVMKCLEKDRARRYDTANALALDLQRYLRNEPVTAGPPSVGYRLSKFVHRHRVPVAAAGLVLLSLVAGVVATGLALNETRNQRELAEQAREDALRRAEELSQVVTFQSSLLGQLDPERIGQSLIADMNERLQHALADEPVPEAARRNLRASYQLAIGMINATDLARQMLDQALLRGTVSAIEQDFANQPTIRAGLLQTVGEVYAGLGFYDAGLGQIQQAHALRLAALGPSHVDTLRSRAALGQVMLQMDRVDGAVGHLQASLDGFDELGAVGDAPSIRTAIHLASAYRRLNRLDEALQLLRQAREEAQRVFGPKHRETLQVINTLALIHQYRGEWQQTEALFREALQKRLATLGEDHPDVLESRQNLGLALWAQYRLDEAEPYLQQALTDSRRIHGQDHPITLQVANGLGALFQAQNRLDDAARLLTDTVERYRRALGERHHETLTALGNLAAVVEAAGRAGDAEALYREAMTGFAQTKGPDDLNTLRQMSNLGLLLAERGDLGQAQSLLAQVVERGLRAFGETEDALIWLNNLASIERDLGHLDSALRRADQAVAAARVSAPPVYLGRFLMTRSRILALMNRHAEAAAVMEEARVLLTNTMGADAEWALEAAEELAEFRARAERET
ncbi:tetratricopeptide repeat protein [Wenzhouxiangella sp. XN79A]|uniref:serine/threonine-protein kinase n=1 Tax=Wenzhouxiangella sp. XN79A TaxID=2724193 RepID=UPI00144AB5F1|nr:serine/threonine-protein kinase [Wenzhouxiangella sp. XN79A]NKI36476.1 tetratricopeptide repeat protein [Wenzhouxiangella sp. XN79A]